MNKQLNIIRIKKKTLFEKISIAASDWQEMTTQDGGAIWVIFVYITGVC